ncbi:MAG: hypothetical protein AB7K52_11520 [Phycisphaerales bacterium]
MLVRRLGLVVAACLLMPALALAQKQPAQPLPPPAPPPGVDIPAWKAAYESANRPTLMVLVGWSTEKRNAPDGAINPEPLTFNDDPGGFAESFRLAICENLCPPEADIELIDAAASRAARQRLANTLQTRREGEAVTLLANETDADLIVLVRLYGDAGRGVPARANMIATNSRGRELLSYTSGWRTGIDPASVLLMGRIFAAEISSKLGARFANPQRYTTRVFGLADAEAAFTMSECLQGARGVTRVSSRRGQGTGRDAYREYEITTSFEQDMLEVFIGRCVAPLELVARLVSLEAGVVNIRVERKPPPLAAPAEPGIAECIDAITERDSPDGRNYRDDLLNLYTRRQQPTFAVLVNRRLTEPERQQLAAAGQPVNAENIILVQSAGAGNNVVAPGGGGGVAPRPGASPDGINAEFDQINEMNNLNVTLEGLVYDLLGTEMLNFNRRVDGPTARAKLAELIDAQKKVFGEDELANLLRRANIAQYMIIGTGTIVIENQQLKARYNFRLVNQDGQFVAGAPDIVEEVAFSDRSAALRRMASRAVAKMACELRQEWRRDNLPTITLKGVSDAQDILSLERVFKADAKLFRFVGNPELLGIGPSSGSARFSISHKADITNTQIIEEMRTLGRKAGFDLVLESSDFSSYVFAIRRN